MKIVRSTELKFVPASHEDPKSPGVFKKILLRGDDLVEGKIETVNTALLPIGQAFTPHYHTDRQEVFIIIRGNAKISVDAEEATLAWIPMEVNTPNATFAKMVFTGPIATAQR